MSTSPQPEFKSEQHEFNAEQNRMINDLAAAMELVATLMKLLGLIFLILFGLLLLHAVQKGSGYGAPVGIAAGMLICLAVGFWTGGSARSFRRIVESQNRDIWHLMNALDSLRNMYSLLRSIILGCIVILVIALALVAYDRLM